MSAEKGTRFGGLRFTKDKFKGLVIDADSEPEPIQEKLFSEQLSLV